MIKHANKAPTSVSVPPVRRNQYGAGAPTNIQVGSSYLQAGQENRAPTTYTEPGSNVGSAPTTVSVPPQQATSMLEQHGNSLYMCRQPIMPTGCPTLHKTPHIFPSQTYVIYYDKILGFLNL